METNEIVLSNLFKSGELDENSVHSILEYTAADGKIYKTTFYNMNVPSQIFYTFASWTQHKLINYQFKALKIMNRSQIVTGCRYL